MLAEDAVAPLCGDALRRSDSRAPLGKHPGRQRVHARRRGDLGGQAASADGRKAENTEMRGLRGPGRPAGSCDDLSMLPDHRGSLQCWDATFVGVVRRHGGNESGQVRLFGPLNCVGGRGRRLGQVGELGRAELVENRQCGRIESLLQ